MGWRDAFGFGGDVVRGKHAKSWERASNSSCDTHGESQDELAAHGADAEAGTDALGNTDALGETVAQTVSGKDAEQPSSAIGAATTDSYADGGDPVPRKSEPVDIASSTQRTRMVSLRLTESDYRALQRACREYGTDRSTYLRHLVRARVALGSTEACRILVIDRTSMMAAVREMVTWGRLYNQAVHALNTIALRITRGNQIDKAWLQEQLDRIELQLGMVEDGRDDILLTLGALAKLPAIRGN